MVMMIIIIVVHYLHYGWLINYQPDVLPRSTLKSTPLPSKIIFHMDYLVDELAHRAIIGSFTYNPFSCP